MENITLGEISTFIILLATLGTSIGILIKNFKKWLESILKPLNDTIIELDKSQCKNFLVRFLADVEQKNELDEVEKERAYEIYDHYTNDLKQNSYIHKRWEELMNGSEKNEN